MPRSVSTNEPPLWHLITTFLSSLSYPAIWKEMWFQRFSFFNYSFECDLPSLQKLIHPPFTYSTNNNVSSPPISKSFQQSNSTHKMGQHYKDIASIALKRRSDAIPQELLLPSQTTANLPRNVTSIPQTSGHFSPEELAIINSSAIAILANIKNRKWTSLEVTKAFCKSSAVAQQLVCFLMPCYVISKV